MLLFYVYLLIVFNIIKIVTNYICYCQYYILYIKHYSTILSLTTLYLWFLIFMFITLLILIYYTSKKVYNKTMSSLLGGLYLILYCIISALFISEDCIVFIIAFETMLFTILATSMYYLFNNRFIIAMYYLIIFSIFSGIACFMLLFILFININISGYLLLINALIINNFTTILSLWFITLVIFGIKFPIYPFYFWLLAVHVEVSSEMSTLLAGIILKSGFIGMLKFLIIMMASVSFLIANINVIFVCIGLLMCTINLLIITDYKKIIGSWSILHVNVTLIFVWYNNYLLVILFILSNLGHILSSSSFFLCISFTYENFNNKHIFMISSAFSFNVYSFLFIFLVLNNIDFPFFLLFYVELLNFFAIIFVSNYLLLMLTFIIITLFVSTLLLYFILNYYSNKWNNAFIRLDINIAELLVFISLVIYGMVLYWFISIF